MRKRRNQKGLEYTESGNPLSAEIDKASALKIAKIMNREDEQVALAVRSQLGEIAQAIELVNGAFSRGGRLFYVGAGTSGRLGMLDAVECVPTFNVSPKMVQAIIAGGKKALWKSIEGAEDDGRAGIKAIKKAKIGPKDVVCGISASGKTIFVRSALREAHRLGAKCIFITCQLNPTAPAHDALIINPIVGPEVIAGSTRLKAGTATKMVLNMISTGAMIRQGRVHSNLMVEVRPVSRKLKKRAERIVTSILNCSLYQARRLLKEGEYIPKVALVMGKRKCSAQEARQLIAAQKDSWKELLGRNSG